MTQQRLQDIPKAYDPRAVEGRIYQFWMERGYFTPTMDGEKRPFVIIMPPPNVTGELHLGHAITATIEDALIRWHRMMGDSTLWLPGTDHAGIATQVVVERELAQEGLTRQDLGREAFVERVWNWVHRYGTTIDEQHKRLGASCDWSRKRFTLDEGPSKAVRATFVNLYRKGLIYRGERIINWCPRCATALSDLEVDHQEEQAHLYYIRYPYVEGDGHLTVATTRPETLPGDTAVAVNPDDPRFRDVLGREAYLPILHRPLPVIGDTAVDIEFGTGALKITPGHDPTDFEVGQRHHLPIVNTMNLDATMNENAGPYQGMDRYDCREAILKDLEREGLLERVEPYHHAVGHCQRCDTIVEPLVSKQWFVQMAPLAQPAIKAVQDGRIRIVPERFTRVYLNWMENIRDWCISRQLWWGHRIPVWYCDDCGGETVDHQDPTTCAQCRSGNIQQDPDVLDTWFSSALWPHSTLGWPDDAQDLRYFYPTAVMETAYDILFFWVARMIMMGLENTGEIPFQTVYIHGLIRDDRGQKMSKTRGNVIDPLGLADRFGTDALRFALTTGTTPGNDTRLTEAKVEAARNFANKLWNAARFVMMSLEEAPNLQGWSHLAPPTHREDRWILSRLHHLTHRVETLLTEFQLGEAEREIHDFLWGEYCDWYIELAKIRLRQGEREPLQVLAHVLERVLRLLHPFMPFITEEIWQNLLQRLPREGYLPDSLMLAPYPTSDDRLLDANAEAEMELAIGIVRAIRNIRAEFKINPSFQLSATIKAAEDADYQSVRDERQAIEALARTALTAVARRFADEPDYTNVVKAVVGGVTVNLHVGLTVDLQQERQRLERELADCHSTVQRLGQHLQDQEFLYKAPEAVVERERQRLESLEERWRRIEELLSRLVT